MPKNILEEYNYRIYTYKVLKQVHPDTQITLPAQNELNCLLHHIIQRTMEVSKQFVANRHEVIVTSRDIQSSVRLILPSELSKHAVSEGVKAITKYTSSITSSSNYNKGSKKQPVRRSARAGLVTSVSRTENIMRHHMGYKGKLSAGAQVYMTAVIEYLAAELLEGSGNIARDNRLSRITTRHITLAILNDDELESLFKDVTLSGGVMPTINLKKTKS